MSVDKAIENFKNRYRCSEAILTAYCEDYGLDRENAMKLGCALGGGLGSSGGVCGAASAAVLVIGLKFGRSDVADRESVGITNQKVRQFLDLFRSANGNLSCNDLIGFDRSSPDGDRLAREKGIYRDLCPKLVESAARILEDVLEGTN